MTAQLKQRPAAIRVAIPFVFRHWLNQPARAAAVAGGLLGATVADLFMPLFSGRLVDALTLRIGSGRATCGGVGVWRHRGARPGLDDPAADRVAGDRAVHAQD